jgi:hypothetical protein
MALVMRTTYDKVNDTDIDKLEADLGFALPLEYREFLKDHNGGLPENYLFVDDDDEIAVRFFGIGLGPEFDYDDVLATLQRLEDRIPAGFMPIGADPGGNLVLLGTEGDRKGRVFYLDLDAEPGAPSSVRQLSQSLRSFAETLQRDPGEP